MTEICADEGCGADSITDSAGLFINWLNNVVAERAYSRKLEMEADAVGLNVSAWSGLPVLLVIND
jgi:hypothetical protein